MRYNSKLIGEQASCIVNVGMFVEMGCGIKSWQSRWARKKETVAKV